MIMMALKVITFLLFLAKTSSLSRNSLPWIALVNEYVDGSISSAKKVERIQQNIEFAKLGW